MLTILDLYLALPSQHHQCLETYSCSAYTERETEKIVKEKPGWLLDVSLALVLGANVIKLFTPVIYECA